MRALHLVAQQTARGVFSILLLAGLQVSASDLAVDSLRVMQTATVTKAFTLMGAPTVSTNTVATNIVLSGTFTNGLMAYYPFAPSNEAADASGNGNTLTFYGSYAFDSSAPADHALVFDGESVWAKAASSDSLNLTNGSGVTVAAWVQFDDLVGGAPNILGKNDDNVGGYYFFTQNWSEYNTTLSWWIGGWNIPSSRLSQAPFTSFSSLQGTWHHWVATYDSATGNQGVYVDGAAFSVNQINTTNSIPLASSADLVMGQHYCECGEYGFMFGKMAQVAIWNRALSTEEIGELSTGAGPNTNTLIQAEGTSIQLLGATLIKELVRQGDVSMGIFTNKP